MYKTEEEFSLKQYFVPFTTTKAIVFIIILGFIVFSNMLFNQFVWDDLSYIVYNPDIHTINILALFRENSFNNPLGQYRAITATYFAVLFSAFHLTPFFYHLIQLGIHITNTVLVYLLFKKFFNHKLSYFLSLIFLTHPIQAEAVSFIGSSGNPLFFLFGIIALILVIQNKFTLKKILTVSVCLLISLLTKEVGLAFLLLALSVNPVFRHKLRPALLFSLLTSFIIYLTIRFGIGGVYFNNSAIKNVIPINGLSLFSRLLNIPAVLFFYFKTFFFPSQLVIDQQWVVTSLNLSNFILPLFVLLFLLFLIIFLGYHIRKNKTHFQVYLFFLLWLIVGLGIHMQIIPLDATVADRWFYFPMVGLLGLIGLVINEIPVRLYGVFPVCIITLLSFRTLIRNSDWKDNITLYSHDARIIDNYEMESNLGGYLSYANRYAEALPHTLKSTQLYAFDTNLSNLGFIYEQLNNYEKAQQYYQQATVTKNISTNHLKLMQYTYLRWAGLYLFHNNPIKATDILTRATEEYPNDGILWSYRAVAEYDSQQQSRALLSAQKAKTLFPGTTTDNLYQLILNHKPVDISRL